MHDIDKLSTFEERMAKIHEGGFKCGHLALGKMFSDFPITNEVLTPGFAMYIKDLFAKYEIQPAVLGCYINLSTPNEEQLKKTVETFRAHIRFAKWLGIGVVGTESFAPNESGAFCPECHTQEALELFIERLRPIVAYAEQMGVVVAVEPAHTHIVSDPKRARYMLDTIASPNLMVIFDPVNMLNISDFENRQAIFDEAMELLGPDICMVHLKDATFVDGQYSCPPAGFGDMDYLPILKFIKEKKPHIHVTLENTKPENNQQAKNYILQKYEEA